jgi:two-component system, OmpR family, KDP operon response regulator KdpE
MKRPQTFTVLLLDDEPAVRSALAAGGFAAIEVRTAEEAVHLVGQQSFDLVLLDMSVPGGSGVEACWKIRAIDPRAGIILVTRPEEDKAPAFEAGADYCLTKPTQCRELVACFHAVLRRTLPGATAEPESAQAAGRGVKRRRNLGEVAAPGESVVRKFLQRAKAGKLELDFELRTLWKAGMEVHLSPKEFDLLALLMEHEGIPLTQEYLLCEAWGSLRARQPRHLRAYIRRLRQKIEDDPKQPRCILTEQRFGYCFRSPSGTIGVVPGAGQESTDLSRSSRTTDSPGAVTSPESLACLTTRPAACALPSRYASPFRSSAHSQSRLIALSIRDLREEIRANAVSFPSQTPVFHRHDRPDLQWKLAQLYFVRGWSCESIAVRYQIAPGRVRGILKTWKRRAIETGYVQCIPPAKVLWTAMPKDSPEAPKLSSAENGQSTAYLGQYSNNRNTLRRSRFRPFPKRGPARLHGL